MTVLDSLNKVVANTSDMQMTADQIRDLLTKAVGPSTKIGDKEEKDRKKIEKILEGYTDYLEQLTKDSSETNKALEGMRRDMKKGGRGGGGGVAVGAGLPNPEGLGTKEGKEYMKGWNSGTFRGIQVFASTLSSMLSGGTNAVATLFSGLGETMQFKKEMREIAFQTQGITAASRGLQNEFSDIGTVVAETGQELSVMQRLISRDLRKGLSKSGIEVTKIGAHLSTMVSTDVNETTEMFTTWHQQLGLSANVMQQIGNNAQDVAKLTGVTGANLQKAMQSSTKFMMNLRNVGQLTATANKTILTSLAEAEKLGVTDQVEKTLGALTGAKQFFGAPQETQNLLGAAAASSGGKVSMNDVLAGNVLKDRDKIQGLLGGIDNLVKNIAGVDLNNLDNVDPDKLWQVNNALQSAYGMSLEEFKRHKQALELQGMSLADFTAKMQKENENQMTTEEEKLANLAKIEQKKLSMSEQFSLEAAEMIRKKGLEGGLAAMDQKIGKSKTDTKDIGFLRKDLGLDGMGDAQVALVAQSKQLAKMRGKDVSAKLIAALKSKDTKAIGESVADLGKATREYQTDQQKSLDPMTAAAMEMKKLNEAFANKIAPFLTAVIDFIGPTGVMVGIFSAIALQLGASVAGIAGTAIDIAQFAGNSDMLKNAGTKGMGLLSGAGKAISGGASKGMGLLGGTGKAISGVAGKAGGLLTGVGAKMGLGLGAKAAGAGAGAAGAAAGASNPIGWIVMALTSSIAGIEAGATAAAKATEIFHVETATASQKWAADSAGYFTGFFDFLTFGLFGSFLGPTGTLTKMLAKFYDVLWPLNMAVQASLIPLKVLWGIIKGIGLFLYEVFTPVFETLWTDVLVPIGESLSEAGGVFGELGTAISDIMSSLLGGPGGGFIDISGSIAEVMREAGKAVGGFVKGTIGFIKSIWPYIGPIISMINPFTRVFGMLMNLGKILTGLKDIIKGIFIFDPKMIGNGFQKAVGGLLSSLTLLPGKIFDSMWSLFTELPGMIVDGIIAAKDYVAEKAKGAGRTGANVAGWGAQILGGPIGGTLARWGINKAAEAALGPEVAPAKASGTNMILNDGLAMVHRGEAIIPASAMAYSDSGSYVNPIMGNITDTVRGEKATSPSANGGDGMSRITDLTVEQNMLLSSIASGINQMVSIMGSQGGGDTETERVPLRSSTFGRWPYTAASGGSRQITEVGL